MQPSEIADWIEVRIKSFVEESPDNRLGLPSGERAFDQPLVAFASGDDPNFAENKRRIGEVLWTPPEACALALPQAPAAEAGELTVIAWVLPQTEATKRENAAREVYPSERWARARGPGEQFNDILRRLVVHELTQAGIPAAAPVLLPDWSMEESSRYGFASRWSERHAAYAAGLGTFGRCDGLITPKGKAVRVGSVTARVCLPPTPRPYEDHHAYCLFYSQGACRECVDRCPVNALSPQGHDKKTCRAHTHGTARKYVEQNYGLPTDCCGLCQVNVPCSSGIPAIP